MRVLGGHRLSPREGRSWEARFARLRFPCEGLYAGLSKGLYELNRYCFRRTVKLPTMSRNTMKPNSRVSESKGGRYSA